MGNKIRHLIVIAVLLLAVAFVVGPARADDDELSPQNVAQTVAWNYCPEPVRQWVEAASSYMKQQITSAEFSGDSTSALNDLDACIGQQPAGTVAANDLAFMYFRFSTLALFRHMMASDKATPSLVSVDFKHGLGYAKTLLSAGTPDAKLATQQFFNEFNADGKRATAGRDEQVDGPCHR